MRMDSRVKAIIPDSAGAWQKPFAPRRFRNPCLSFQPGFRCARLWAPITSEEGIMIKRSCPRALVKACQAALFLGLLAFAFTGRAQSEAAQGIHHEASAEPALPGPRIVGGTPGRAVLFF